MYIYSIGYTNSYTHYSMYSTVHYKDSYAIYTVRTIYMYM